ncbi:unnamed protein product [Sphagnum troendelagicum]|uniref:Secreted protein n=1 Tax=Sphagnum troendelagicum TaxID=128251 RepID=A0ABP0UA72_9BRYO
MDENSLIRRSHSFAIFFVFFAADTDFGFSGETSFFRVLEEESFRVPEKRNCNAAIGAELVIAVRHRFRIPAFSCNVSSSKYGGVTEYESVVHREWWRISADESKTAL